MSSYDHLLVNDDGAVRVVTLNRPENVRAVEAFLESRRRRAAAS